MRRSIPTLLLISAAIALTACGEYSTTEPLSGAKNAGLAPSFAGYAVTGDCDPTVDPTCVATAAASLVPGTPTVAPVKFYATGGTIHFGNLFTLVYRQNSVSICDDINGTTCKPLSGSVGATATYGLNAAGAPYLDIELPGDQHVYFATPGAKLLTSFYANNYQSIVAKGKPLGLVYAPTLGVGYEPNAPKSHFDAAGNLWRWISHFSGYAVTGDCDPSVDPSCPSSPSMD